MFTSIERKSPRNAMRRVHALIVAGLWASALALIALTVVAWLSAPAKAAPVNAAQTAQTAQAASQAPSSPVRIKAPTGIGRDATPAEVSAWDIDVRPDFKGLPKGQGSVADGQKLFDARCASCHGTFGESNEVFNPLVGGTTAEDIKTGHVASLRANNQPVRTTLMKVDTVSTIWDYIRRAMPWNAPRSLTPDEVYAVTAYILNLGEIVPSDFVLSDKNIADVQKLMPNRNGMTRAHGMWRVGDKPDTHNKACMQDCPEAGIVTSALPAYARDAHGDLAAQNRVIGPVRGVDTKLPPLSGTAAQNASVRKTAALATLGMASPDAPAQTATATSPAATLADKNGCLACHGVTDKKIGPAFSEVATKYHGQSDATEKLVAKIRAGGAGNWGSMPMPPQAQVAETDVRTMVDWILRGAH
ncbi:c-type cytochrome [Pandoraea apista]|uniref:C-type cytochrome n=1 Tax=Pandoraea apista TaxID=93218 RepID=A0A5E5NXL5_9BURK|nr:c-type cytochrome [Pandoraea apista]OXS94813.1 cytochrome C [Pandoraea apista]PTD99645.1 cytochrome C [Pandoraea apista]RRJ31074.1 cytochrome C [Pandoraea apista]RRJ81330.1 cytochrome C [Pandoraea apista]RSD11249.1 c-type cytochrome [Pandoraea apista]